MIAKGINILKKRLDNEGILKMVNKDEAKAAQVLQEAEQKRVKTCYAEIEKILEKYNCRMETDVRFIGREIFRSVVILPKRDQRDPGLMPGKGIRDNPVIE